MDNWKEKFWKYSTIIAVILISLNPEMLSFALMIDAVGLELILRLLEVQVVLIIAAYYGKTIKPILLRLIQDSLYYLSLFSKKTTSKPNILLLAAPGPAALMNTVVIGVLLGTVVNTN